MMKVYEQYRLSEENGKKEKKKFFLVLQGLYIKFETDDTMLI